MTKVGCTPMQTGRRQPFCWPSWLSLVGQNSYFNLNQSCTVEIHLGKLEDIRLKMTKLE